MDSNGTRSRKRKPGSPEEFDSDKDSDTETIDEDFRGEDKKKSWQKGYTKQNHSEIEKRRRDKMNTYIVELSSMIPMCNAMSRKLDKLTVLRMAVQHMKTLKGAEETCTETKYKPSFLSDEDLKNLILEAAEGFLLVVGCERGCILYVSDSIQNHLSHVPSDLVGHSFFDLVHPKDMAKVKEQLSFSDTMARGNVPSPKANAIAKHEATTRPGHLCSGARRSFFCRMKCSDKGKGPKDLDVLSSEPCLMNRKNKNKNSATAAQRKYAVVHSTGYLKSWPPAGAADDDDEAGVDSRNLSCLVAVCRVQKIHDENTDYSQPGVPREFVSRHGLDGKFIFVDHRTTTIIGYLPQELLGMSAYEFFHQDDLGSIAISHKRSLEGETVVTDVYRFRAKAGHYIPIQTKTSSFRNPWTKELEFLLCVNSVITGFESFPPDVGASRPSQSIAGPGNEGSLTPAHRALQQNISQLVHGLNNGQPEEATRSSSKRSQRPSVDGEGVGTSDPRVARIGALVLEEIHNQKASSRGKRRSDSASRPSSSSDDGQGDRPKFPGSSAPGMSTIDLGAILGEGDARLGSAASPKASLSNTGATAASPSRPVQSYLLDQLIGMQNAIEAMDGSAVEQSSEDSMSAFMNMFDGDPALGGDFDDLTFNSAS